MSSTVAYAVAGWPLSTVLGVVGSGCALLEPPPAPPPPPPPSISIARLYEQPAERAFINGMRFYEDGQYERAEVMFKRALAEGLRDRNDVAAANKHLAFIACAYSRPAGMRVSIPRCIHRRPELQVDRCRSRPSTVGTGLHASRCRASEGS